jgi:hypothetical protein
MPAGGDSKHMIASPNTVMDFMSTSEGLALAKAFMKIRSMPMRRRIVELVEGIGDGRLHLNGITPRRKTAAISRDAAKIGRTS